MKPNERFRMLMIELSSKAIDMDQFLLKCAEWTAEDIDEYHFKPIPARPVEMSFVDEVPEYQRNMLSSEFYNAHPQILNYTRTLQSIKFGNKALYDWLMECRKILMQHDRVSAVYSIDLKLKEQER